MSLFTNLIKYIAALLDLVMENYDAERIREGMRECQKGINKVYDAMRYAKTIGEKQHLEACLRNIKSLRAQLKAAQKKGTGLTSRPEGVRDRVKWEDSESAFNGRMRTGVISNLKHKDVSAFLIDCKAIFKRRIQIALKKDEAVKVNCVFNGEFEIVKKDSVLNDHKYFTTSNSAIYRDTDLDYWFESKVLDPIKQELEEFQERDSGWALKKVVNLGVNINKFTAQLGS